MADHPIDAPAPEVPNRFDIQKIYTKDISFETPNSPAIFNLPWEPNISMQLNTGVAKLSELVFEVVLGITVTATLEDKTAYLAEIQQAGIFTLDGFSEHDRDIMLGSYCPNILYPFARAVIAELIGKGGFSAFYLKPVNFDLLYMQHLEASKSPQPSDTVQ